MDSKSKVEEVKKNVLERIEFLREKSGGDQEARFDSMETRRCLVDHVCMRGRRTRYFEIRWR